MYRLELQQFVGEDLALPVPAHGLGQRALVWVRRWRRRLLVLALAIGLVALEVFGSGSAANEGIAVGLAIGLGAVLGLFRAGMRASKRSQLRRHAERFAAAAVPESWNEQRREELARYAVRLG